MQGLTETISEQIDRAITESLGKCWHEQEPHGDLHTCEKCGQTEYQNIDYTTDANACVELWADGMWVGKKDNRWLAHIWTDPNNDSIPPFIRITADTLQLAICKAYLKSKGIELED